MSLFRICEVSQETQLVEEKKHLYFAISLLYPKSLHLQLKIKPLRSGLQQWLKRTPQTLTLLQQLSSTPTTFT